MDNEQELARLREKVSYLELRLKELRFSRAVLFNLLVQMTKTNSVQSNASKPSSAKVIDLNHRLYTDVN